MRNQFAKRRRVGAIPLEDAIGDADLRFDAVMDKEAVEQRARRGAIDIIVAEDRNTLAAHDRLGNAAGGLVHVGHDGRIRHQVADRGIKETGGVFCLDAAARQHPGNEFGNFGCLGDRQRSIAGARIQPVAPLLAKGRAANA